MRKKLYRVVAAVLPLFMVMQNSLVYAGTETPEIYDAYETVVSKDLDEYTENPSETVITDGNPSDIEDTTINDVPNNTSEDTCDSEATVPINDEDNIEKIIREAESSRPMYYANEEPDESDVIYIHSTEDFVNLSNTPANTYQNASIIITRASGVNFNLVGSGFAGFGSEEYPFSGKLTVANGATNDIEIPVDCSFFNYLDQKAEVAEGLFLKAAADISTPILAANFVNSTDSAEPSVLPVRIDTAIKDEDDGTAYAFAGIIGTMGVNAQLELSVENKAEADLLQLSSEDDNLGLFCNTMLSGSSLTIKSFSGTSDINLSTSGGHAGGVVGCMEENSQLIIDTPLTLSGDVEATGISSSVGGLVGKATDAIITLNELVTVDENILADGASCAGGYIGDAEYSGISMSLDFSNYNMKKSTITGGNHAGGVFGSLKYAGRGTFAINSISDVKASHSGTSWQYGGLAGIYTTNDLTAELNVSGINIEISESGTVTSMGGLIGFVGDSLSDGAVTGADAAYINVNNVAVTVDGTATNNGGLIGELGTSGHFLDANGLIQVKSSAGKTMSGTAVGGLVGLSHGGVIRIAGTTDLSGLAFTGTGVQYGQILGARGLNSDNGTLCYALGLGDGDGSSEYGWKLIRPTSHMAVSTVGCYGDVVRLDGTELTETVRSGGFVRPSSISSETEVVSYYAEKHQVIPCMQSTGAVTIKNKRDFITTAIMIQFGNTTVTKGSFNKYADAGSTLLKQTITIDSGLSLVDLSNTGVVGLLRDNGNQIFTGTFNGNNCTVKLAAGQTYGVGASAEVGSGQLYNHEAVGLLGVVNGTVKNLTLDGSIDFGMTSGGVVTYCGAVAGKVQAATVSDVTVQAAINYHTGLSGSAIPISYVGGYFGASAVNSKTISFTDCSMHSNITNDCTAYDYYLGGYIGYINNSSIIVNVKDCSISEADIKAGSSTNSGIGGLVAYIDNVSANTINVDGFEIDNLSINNSATDISGGLLGYIWKETSFNALNIQVHNSSLETTGRFGGLVYEASGYWKIGDGNGTTGIAFEEGNTFSGKSASATPSALLLSSGRNGSSSVYLEILKDGLLIRKDSVYVTLSADGGYFDDLVGKTKYSDGTNAIVSIGLTSKGASEPVLINTTERNTWQNQCSVNGSSAYKNSKTRYYYNLDFYRQPDAKDISTLALNAGVDSEGDLLCWSVYIDSSSNIRKYFAQSVGGDITGEIDLTGVSIYPVKSYLDIKNAEITFGYEPINSLEVSENNKPLSDSNLQHYQMQTGLFTDIVNVITTNINDDVLFTVNGLTLNGTFGPYTSSKGGALICSSAVGGNATYKTIVSLNNIVLDGIRCTDTKKPLLINSLGNYTTTSVTNLCSTDKYTDGSDTSYAASSLIGTVGSATGLGINIDFSDIGLDARTDSGSTKVYGTYHTIFTKATFLDSFQYSDENSGGSYNFDSDSDNITLGKEISNTTSGRNPEGQYCYFDTYGTTEYVVDNYGPGTADKSIDNRFTTGYLPYVGLSEAHSGQSTYHELDINQKAFYILDGCGTYGDPYQIKTVLDEDGNVLVSAQNQMLAIRDVLDNRGNGTVLCVNTQVLNAKKDSVDLHTASSGSTNDVLYIKDSNAWYPAIKKGNHYQKLNDENAISIDDMLTYVRNAYFEIGESMTLDLSSFNGIGGSGAKNAFSGVIVGKQLESGEYPTITLECTNGRAAKGYEIGGLIRYSQGSVVKNLNIEIGNVSLNSSSNLTKPAFFGSVIGWQIGGDNIIDNVKVSMASDGEVSIIGDKNWLTAIGGYVGYVSSNDCIMGGGVVFRNISSAGLDSVNYRLTASDEAVTVNISQETDGLNPTMDRYYWNPYIGRVLEGYACAEIDTCASMGTNTNKNYKIPKIDRNDTITIKNDEISQKYKKPDLPIRSTTTIDSPQDLWVLSSLVNSGAACRATNDQLLVTADGNNQTVSEAYYYGRARTGTYDSVGTISWSAEDSRDEADTWGGVGDLWPEQNYLATFTDNYVAASYLTIDVGYRQITMLQNDYDMTSYGNGYRGIGASTYYDAATGNSHFALKLRMMRIAGKAVVGNGSTVEYTRNIYEYTEEPTRYFNGANNAFQTRQAGMFNIYNQKNAPGEVSNLDITMSITTNQKINRIDDDKVRIAFGGLGGRTSYNYGDSLTLNNVKIMDGSRIDGGYYVGGFLGKIINQCEGEKTYVIKNCSVSNISITDAVYAGGFIGQIPKKLEIKSSISTGNTIRLRDENITCYAGGLIGQATNQLTVDTSTVSDFKVSTSKLTSTGSVIGGVVGNVSGVTSVKLNKITVSNMKAISRGYVGGVAGSMTADIKYAISNTDIKDSYIVTATNDRYAGGLVGYLGNGSLNGFNVRSKDSVVGYLIKKNAKNQSVLDTAETSVYSNGTVDLSLLDDQNVGLRQKNGDNFYWSYSVLKGDSTKLLTDSHTGIWVGNANNRDVKIVSASRQGECSAVKNIGRNETANSYVIYADYTGAATASGTNNAACYVNAKPESGVTIASKKLTSDGACLVDGSALSNKIIDDTLDKDYMKGYFGANAGRSLDSLVSSFREDYGDVLSTYKTEETTSTYKGKDIPILVLEMTSSAEVNKLIKSYISVLTNKDQTATAKYVSITPKTYKASSSSWVVADTDSLIALNDNTLKINPGKYDNTKNQITVLDVLYQSPIDGSKDVYHLYIPVLVKKVMDISFAVKVVNGATGYESAYKGDNATLASFGEDYTAMLTYTYTWTADEWNSAISNGADLLWSFNKQVSLDNLSALDLSKMRLTLVDMNTHGDQKTFYQSSGSIIKASDGQLIFEDFPSYKSVPICDLLPLIEKKGTEDAPGVLKRVDKNDANATLRRWDAESKMFIYYAVKDEESDPEDTVYYNVSLDGEYKGDDAFDVCERYYLVMNCTEGHGVHNKIIQLGTNKLEGGVPSRVHSKGNAIYVLGDFYSLNSMELRTVAENSTSTVMRPGTNDYIDVDVSTDIGFNGAELASYVNNRPVYFRYAIHMTDENSTPVPIEAANTYVQSLMIGTTVLPNVSNLDEVDMGYVLENSGSTTYVTMKAPGNTYIGQKVNAVIRYIYDDGASLIAQFPVRTTESDRFGVKFQTSAGMAYEYASLGSTNMSGSRVDDKLYYTEESSFANLSYDSYNITSVDGNTSQLGLNGRETKGESVKISSRAMFDATAISGLDRTNSSSARYPYYLEGTLSLGKKTETDKVNGVGKTYTDVKIQDFLSDFAISSEGARVDVSSAGLGKQDDGTYKFRVALTEEQVANLLTDKILINIDYKVQTDALEAIQDGQYANYKVTLKAMLKNKDLGELTNEPTDYLIYTNAKIYLGIVGVTDIEGD